MNFRKLFTSAAALALVIVVGCSSSTTASGTDFNCPAVGEKNCTNDSPATQEAVDLCKKCLSQGRAYATCEGFSAKASCGSDGKSVAQKVDLSKCKTELDAELKCFSGM